MADLSGGTGPDGGGRRPWIVGVSGASGTPYAAAVVRALVAAGLAVDLVVTRAARLTLMDETGVGLRDAHWREDVGRWLATAAGPDDDAAEPVDLAGLAYWSPGDFAAGPSSGTYPASGMIVVPASAACVAGIALGLSKDLVQRAAAVTMKERRPLVVVPREAPLVPATLRHLLNLAEDGAVIIPPSPAFYAGARHVQQLVDFVAGRILDAVGVPHTLYRRWDGVLGAARAADPAPGRTGGTITGE